MDATVQELFSSGLAPSTRRVYQSGGKRYALFCTEFGFRQAFPVTEQLLVRFVAKLYQDGLSGGTVKSYLAAVRHAQITLGLGDPHRGGMPQLEYVIKGMKKKTGDRRGRSRLPITPEILIQLRGVWWSQDGGRDRELLWAASCMCFFGFLRMGEVVVPSDAGYDSSSHLSQGDVRVDNVSSPQYLQVIIKASKTDPFRQGVAVFIGKAPGVLCPVTAILRYMVRRGSGQGPFFILADGKYLTRARFVVAIRTALAVAGIDASRYSGHSFRIGAATTAAQKGVSDSLIKTMGRWESSAYLVYIRTPRPTLCAVAGTLVS